MPSPKEIALHIHYHTSVRRKRIIAMSSETVKHAFSPALGAAVHLEHAASAMSTAKRGSPIESARCAKDQAAGRRRSFIVEVEAVQDAFRPYAVLVRC